MESIELTVTGMTCGNCVAHVAKALEAVRGVKAVEVTLPDRAVVTAKGAVPMQALLDAAVAAGYPAHMG